MKTTFISLLFTALLLVSCGGNDETKLEAFSAEAFAFNIGEGWEVNASTRVKGFMQNENEGSFSAGIAYNLDIVKPEGDTIKALISRTEDLRQKESYTDVPIDVQFELDSAYATGSYTLIFNIKDLGSGQTAVSETVFELD